MIRLYVVCMHTFVGKKVSGDARDVKLQNIAAGKLWRMSLYLLISLIPRNMVKYFQIWIDRLKCWLVAKLQKSGSIWILRGADVLGSASILIVEKEQLWWVLPRLRTTWNRKEKGPYFPQLEETKTQRMRSKQALSYGSAEMYLSKWLFVYWFFTKCIEKEVSYVSRMRIVGKEFFRKRHNVKTYGLRMQNSSFFVDFIFVCQQSLDALWKFFILQFSIWNILDKLVQRRRSTSGNVTHSCREALPSDENILGLECEVSAFCYSIGQLNWEGITKHAGDWIARNLNLTLCQNAWETVLEGL